MLDGIMSPQSFYLAMVILGSGGLAYFSWPVAKRVWEIPKNRKKKEREKRQKRQAGTITTITNLKEILNYPYCHSDPSSVQDTKELIYKQKLISNGIVPEWYGAAKVVDGVWTRHLNDILPYIIRYGVDQGVARYERDTNREIVDDEDGEGPRTE